MRTISENKQMLGYELASKYPDIYCFVTTRHGGYSVGNYASFNCTPYTGDDEVHVKQNVETLKALLPEQDIEMVIPVQTHSASVACIDEDWKRMKCEQQKEMLNSVDALVTNQSGYCLCISTADCVPILLFDKMGKVVAAAHAGWRGTVADIVSETLSVMKKRYHTDAANVIAMIGPSISQHAFEVGDEVIDAFQNAGFPMQRISYRNEKSGKGHIDLWKANKYLLEKNGVPEQQIEVAGVCTYSNEDMFFSARRLGIHSGRILSGILLLKDANNELNI